MYVSTVLTDDTPSMSVHNVATTLFSKSLDTASRLGQSASSSSIKTMAGELTEMESVKTYQYKR